MVTQHCECSNDTKVSLLNDCLFKKRLSFLPLLNKCSVNPLGPSTEGSA